MPYLKSRITLGINENYPSTILMWKVIVGLLVVLNVVCGSAEDSKDELACGSGVCGERAPAGWKSPKDIVDRLKEIGFELDESILKVLVKPYTPVQPTVSDSDTNPCLSSSGLEEKTGLSIVDTRTRWMKFIMPKYSSAKEANADLEFLNTIAAIKVSVASIMYTDARLKCRQTCILIVTRIINMLECKKLKLNLKCTLERNNQNQSIYDASLREAKRVIGLTPKSPCALVAWGNTNLSQWGANAIAIKQQFSSIHFHPVDNLSHNLDNLCLTKDFKATVSLSSKKPEVNLRYLFSIPTNCSKITIMATYKPCPLIVGLGDCTKQYKDIKLLISWDNLQLLGRTSKDKIHAHSIMVPDDNCLYKEGSSCSEPPKNTGHCIFADKIVVQISPGFPYEFSKSTTYDYIKDICAKHGVLVKTAEVCGKDDQEDLSETLGILEKLDALPKSATEPYSFNISCGRRLKNAEYITIEEPVNLKFVNWDSFCDSNKPRDGMLFCQHIHYNEINIDGSGGIDFNPFHLLTNTLYLFRDITANKLTIKNIRKIRAIDNFRCDVKEEITRNPFRCNMSVDVLILDNVSTVIAFWILEKYDFVKPVKVYLQNINCSENDAIKLIRPHPQVRNISEFVLDNTIIR
ncbi:hypothetical protein NEHOM01_2064 [Nematocida homosporus]|uniref:uncharacterized protein n=1 Tax=Nematocida homosporus TaxID=1912981 RepID=UPI00221F8C8A|nr:uncharacterized protein NEHOM01_2064 [Nematocida homosporus]KAI5187279.1 hypothetical protein NEHOM01_2064 [Nematocida homosporus]